MRKNNISIGIIWNLFSYVFLGLFTIISYYLITWRYGEAALGAYNIVLSIFMISGHLGVLGLQSAALYYIPQLKDKKEYGQCFTSFLIISVVVSGILSCAVFLTADMIGAGVFHSQFVCEGLRRLPLAIILFSINKMLSGFINALGHMREFAVLQSLRYFFIVGHVGISVLWYSDFTQVFFAFTLSETAVAIVGMIFLIHAIKISFPKAKFIKNGIQFGRRAVLGNIISDMNTKVDVTMLGILCDETLVGYYSFVTIIVEGLFAILFVFRNNYNPLFSSLFYEKGIFEARSLYDRLKKRLQILFGGLTIIVTICYALFVIVFLESSYKVSIIPVAIVIIGCSVMAPYFVAGNLCTLSGKPMIDTFVTFCTIVSNIVFNYFFILKWQLTGAALATSMSYIIFSILTNKMISKYVWKKQ